MRRHRPRILPVIIMRKVFVFGIAAPLIVGAFIVSAPFAGSAVGVWPAGQPQALPQYVDRRHKGNRLRVPSALSKQPMPAKPRPMLAGCDPAFSPLSASKQANFPARCIA